MTVKRFLVYVVVVLAAVALIAILYARHEAGRLSALRAESRQQIARLTSDHQQKMQEVTRYLAAAAARDAQEALTAVTEQDWTAAGKALGGARDAIGVLGDIALDQDKPTVDSAQVALQGAQAAVGEANRAAAARSIGQMIGALGLLPRSGKR
jgi:hypothetical protein